MHLSQMLGQRLVTEHLLLRKLESQNDNPVLVFHKASHLTAMAICSLRAVTLDLNSSVSDLEWPPWVNRFSLSQPRANFLSLK